MVRSSYKTVPTHKLPPGSGFHRPYLVPRVTSASPAVEVMTDLKRVAPATIGPDATIADANQVMIARRVRMLFVVEPGHGLVGLITARDTMGERPITLVRERGGRHGDLLVRDLMVPAADIEVLEWDDILRAEVGHIVTTLKAHGRQHALVVDTDTLTGDEMIRGIFSSTQIGRQLNVPLQPVEIARTFAQIEAELAD